MRKYYYEDENHLEFMDHCNEDCSNVEYLDFGRWNITKAYKKSTVNVWALDCAYRCWVDVPDETPTTKDDKMRKYYYERDNHFEFLHHCADNLRNIEVEVTPGQWMAKAFDSFDVLACMLNNDVHACRCWVDVSEEVPAAPTTKDGNKRLTADGLDIYEFAAALKRGETAQRNLCDNTWNDVVVDACVSLGHMLFEGDMSQWRLKPIAPTVPKEPDIPSWFKVGQMVQIAQKGKTLVFRIDAITPDGFACFEGHGHKVKARPMLIR